MSFKVTVKAKTRTGEIVSESYTDLVVDACGHSSKRNIQAQIVT
mgnify:CR=1 FL=1